MSRRGLPWMLRCASLLLAAAVPAQRGVLDRLPAEEEAAKFHRVAFGDEFEPVVLPCGESIRGLAKLGDTLWVRSGTSLVAVDWPTRKLTKQIAAPANTAALASDGTLLYLLGAREVVVFDPAAMEVVRAWPLPITQVANAFTVHGGALRLVDGGRLLDVDLRTRAVTPGEVSKHLVLDWVGSDGTRMLGSDGVDLMDLTNGKPVRRWPGYLPNVVATWIDGRLLMNAECQLDRASKVAFTGLLKLPAVTEAAAIVVRVSGTGDSLRCEVAGRTTPSLEAMQNDLRGIAADPKARYVAPDGKSRLPRVDLVAGQGVLVGELKCVWQAVVTSGFADVACPAQAAWLREHEREMARRAESK